jgi:hypothetical protein
MKKCHKCGKELKFYEAYYHPALGKKVFICSDCFDVVDESMENYSSFVFSHVREYEEKHVFSNMSIKFKQMVQQFGHKVQ